MVSPRLRFSATLAIVKSKDTLTMPSPYDQDFYESLQEGALQSAREIIPLVMELIAPQTVVDVGCGIGTWLSVFKQFGVTDCLGIDGDYVERSNLQIPQQEFQAFDLKQPLCLDKQFDLVVSLEVAEHLPEECAERFVHSLVNLGPVVLFSAAIPFQGGTDHINEQWPDYWTQLFQAHNYLLVDCLRKRIWNNDKVKPWYAQNLLIFVNQNCLSQYPLLEAAQGTAHPTQLALVHPAIYLERVTESNRETRRRTPIEQPTLVTSLGTELRLNENRFGSLELEITQVNLLNQEGAAIASLQSGEALWIEMEYVAHQPIQEPIFGLTITREDGLVCYDTYTTAADLSIPLLPTSGKITLQLERLDLNGGQYYIDVGVYEQNWAYAYDYHWRAYPLVINPNPLEKGVLYLPHRWQINPTNHPAP